MHAELGCPTEQWVHPREVAVLSGLLFPLPPMKAMRVRFVVVVLVCLASTALWWAFYEDPVSLMRQWSVIRRNIKLLQLLRAFPDQKLVKFSEFQLNVSLSNSLPLDRVVPDPRCSACAGRVYDYGVLPNVSVIIPFYDESWSLLLRALHSVLDKTPPELIHEVILVDDYSRYAYLGEPLANYIRALSPKIRLLRNTKRQGLIRSRLRAAREATAEVLVFLDAHVECTTEWLPPLLDVIRANHTTIAVPHIDTIVPETIAYEPWNQELNGVFTWAMEYRWKFLPERLEKSRKTSDPVMTPTLIGCVIAVNRRFFYDIGAFDEGMYIWGGENLELSFRTWMCGGSVYIVPCSRVGHVFRSYLPYDFPMKFGGRSVKYKNYQRIAEVWMDKYKKYYYSAVHTWFQFTKAEQESLEKRKQLKARLKCQDFSWFLHNIVPEMVVPSANDVYFGQVKNLESRGCISGLIESAEGLMPLMHCGSATQDQVFALRPTLQVVYNLTQCLTVRADHTVTLAPCNFTAVSPSQQWLLDTTMSEALRATLTQRDSLKQVGRLVTPTKLCLTQVSVANMQSLGVMSCAQNDFQIQKFQIWIVDHKLQYQSHTPAEIESIKPSSSNNGISPILEKT